VLPRSLPPAISVRSRIGKKKACREKEGGEAMRALGTFQRIHTHGGGDAKGKNGGGRSFMLRLKRRIEGGRKSRSRGLWYPVLPHEES